MNEQRGCTWTGDIPELIEYHDNEWGRPVHDDGKLFDTTLNIKV